MAWFNRLRGLIVALTSLKYLMDKTPSSNTLSAGTAYLVDCIARRESEILQIVYDSFAPLLYGQIFSVTKEPARAVRILEKTLVYGVRYVHRHNPNLRLYTWFVQVLNFQILLDAANSLAGRILADDRDPDHYTVAWNRLSDPEKQVLELAFFKGCGEEEIAAILEWPVDRVRHRISAALIHFHDLFS